MSGTERVTAGTRTVNANGDGYPTNRTALLLIDPYNDFLSEGGKFWPGVEEVGKEVRLLENLRAITTAVRNAGIDATAAFSQDRMHVAHQLNRPTFAHRILTTAELISELP